MDSPQIVRSAAAMHQLGARLAGSLAVGDVVAICGELGAGKTQLAVGIAAGLGSPDGVSSPTFTLIHEYGGGRLTVYHIDLYRLESADEALAAGVGELLPADDGVTLVEWAGKFPGLIPGGAWWCRISQLPNPDERLVDLHRR